MRPRMTQRPQKRTLSLHAETIDRLDKLAANENKIDPKRRYKCSRSEVAEIAVERMFHSTFAVQVSPADPKPRTPVKSG